MRNFIIILSLPLLLTACLPTAVTKGGKAGPSPGEFTKDEVVAGFPNIPLFPEAQVVESIKVEDSFGATFTTNKSLDEVTTFYTDSLTFLGWESQLVKNSQVNYEFRVKNAQYEGSIFVNTAADGKKTAITYSLTTR